MKKLITGSLLIILPLFALLAQETPPPEAFTPSGTPSFRVYFNYHYDFTEDIPQPSVFEIKRTYFGYKYKFSENVSSRIMLDVGKNSGGVAYTAYLKYAHLDWKVSSPLKISFGLMPSKMFDDQENHWGYRYLYKSLQDEFKFGSSAEMGVNAEIKYTNQLSSDFFIMNGEGYKNLQDDFGMHMYGANLVFKSDFGLTLKAYGSINMKKQVTDTDTTAVNIINYNAFVGYKTKNFRIAAEYNEMLNGDTYKNPLEDHNRTGITVYGTYVINNRYEVFANFIEMSSNKINSEDQHPWNYDEDGQVIIVGGQFAPLKGIKFAVNYRAGLQENNIFNDNHLLYLNFEFRF